MRVFSAGLSRVVLLGLLLGAAMPLAHAGQTLPTGPLQVAQMQDDEAPPAADDPASPAAATVRMDRMENTIRTLTGRVEQLEFQNRKLTDDLRKMQQDVDFRFQDLNRAPIGATPKANVAPVPGKRSEDVSPPGATDGLPQDASGVIPAEPSTINGLRPTRRGDAFDPAANPNAPGAPKPLGTTTASTPLTGVGTTPSIIAAPATTASIAAPRQPSAPLDLMRRPASEDQSTENGVAPIITPDATPPTVTSPVRPAPNPNAVASLAPGGTRDEFNANLDLYKQGQLDGAATGLKGFLDKYPRDRLVPDAVYLLGQTYTKMGRHREAAEQYLRLSTDFSKAPRAPDALLRLGMSLDAMGVREQACATYQEVNRRYPTASPDLKVQVDREIKRSRC